MLSLQTDALLIEVSPHAGAVTRAVTADGRNFLRPLSGPFHVRASACYPLVPLGNRVGGNGFSFGGKDYDLRPNAADPLYLHGDGWLADWSVEQADPTRAELALEMRAPDCGVHIYRACQRFLLDGNRLRIEFDAENLGPEAMPFGLGLHPFMPNDGARVTFNAKAFWTEGPLSLPDARIAVDGEVDFSSGRRLPDIALNNAYEGWDGRAHIQWPDGMTLLLQADPIFSTLMVYAPDSNRSFFCLEPMSHLPNALNMPGMQVLGPGEILSGGVDFTVTG